MISSTPPRMLVIAGPNGSGKTTFARTYVARNLLSGDIYVNPDDIAQKIFGDWNSPDAVVKAARESDRIRNDRLNNRQDLVFEAVLLSREKIDYLVRAKESGYEIHMIFVATESPTINAGRVARRVLEGGHSVPISTIISRFNASIAQAVFVAQKGIVSHVQGYDNSEDLSAPILVFEIANGKIIEKAKVIPTWWRPFLEVIF